MDRIWQVRQFDTGARRVEEPYQVPDSWEPFAVVFDDHGDMQIVCRRRVVEDKHGNGGDKK